jgi:hypothetical protein
MAYKITLVNAGVPTEVTARAASAEVTTHTEGLDSLEVTVGWKLNDLREDPAYETIIYTWPSAMSRLQLNREDTGVLVFDGQVHAVGYSRDTDEFEIHAQS